ncbi:hypothetical protein BHM03_00034897, partial [Ensete ventricosum]
MFAEGGERGVPGRRPLDLSAASRIWPNYFPQVEFALEDHKLKLVVLLADFFCTPQADPFLSQVQDDRGTFFLPIDMQHFQKACGVDEFYAVLEEAPKEALSCMGAAVHMLIQKVELKLKFKSQLKDYKLKIKLMLGQGDSQVQGSRSVVSTDTARYGRCVLVCQQTGTWAVRYRAVPSIGVVSTPLLKKRENLERLRRRDADFSITWGEESLGDIAEVSRGRK